MRINPIGSNKTELHLDDGSVILFSYKTPVAACTPSKGYIRTEHKWSVTTSKHINMWLDGVEAVLVPQSDLDAIVSSAH